MRTLGLVVLGLVSFALQPVRAQVLYGSLVGTIQDASGAVIPGAAVSIENAGTGQALSATSGATSARNAGNRSLWSEMM